MPTAADLLIHAANVFDEALTQHGIPHYRERPDDDLLRHGFVWRWHTRLGVLRFRTELDVVERQSPPERWLRPTLSFSVTDSADLTIRRDFGPDALPYCRQVGNTSRTPKLRGAIALLRFDELEAVSRWLAAWIAHRLGLAAWPAPVSRDRGRIDAIFGPRPQGAGIRSRHEPFGPLDEFDECGRLVKQIPRQIRPLDEHKEEEPLPVLSPSDRDVLRRLCLAARRDADSCGILADFLEEKGGEALSFSSFDTKGMAYLRGWRGGKGFQKTMARSVHVEACHRGLLDWETEPETVGAMRFFEALEALDPAKVPVVSLEYLEQTERARLTRRLFRELGLGDAKVVTGTGSRIVSVDIGMPTDHRPAPPPKGEEGEQARAQNASIFLQRKQKVEDVLHRAFPAHVDSRGASADDYHPPYHWHVKQR
jgi:hypothetical protein